MEFLDKGVVAYLDEGEVAYLDKYNKDNFNVDIRNIFDDFFEYFILRYPL